MLLNVDRLQKQLDKDEFQEDGSMTAFWVVNNQFQNFIDSKFTLDYDSQMTDTRFFVQISWKSEVQHFRDTLLPTPGTTQHNEQPEIINEVGFDQYLKIVRGNMVQILKQQSNRPDIEKEIDVLETMNIELEHSVATLHSGKGFAIAALKNDLRKLKE
ncbi:hypothetical protein Tco_1509185 [Tanacetum coccineum]